jgi:hypothetical protein
MHSKKPTVASGLWRLVVFVILASAGLSARLAAANSPAKYSVWLLDIQGMSSEEKFSVFALQGLLNRAGPRVFLKAGKDCRWMSFDLDSRSAWSDEGRRKLVYRYGAQASIEDYWIDYYTQNGTCEFKPTSLPRLLLETKLAKGWIVYESIQDDCCPAATMAGLLDAIPATRQLIQALAAQGVKMPVIFDYASIHSNFPAGGNCRLSGHLWAITNLLARCAHDGAVSRDRTYGLDAHDTIMDVDQAAQKRWFVYDLDYSAKRNGAGSMDTADLPILDRILKSLRPFSPVFGWGRPNEEDLARTVGRHKAVVVCSGVINNSFFAALPRSRSSWRQINLQAVPETVKLENKIYVAFLVNEGDSIKAAISLGNAGNWLQPERGKIPINWGLDPLLGATHPALMDFYYDSMTTNDYFFAATSGWGYLHPDFVAKDFLQLYAGKVGQGVQVADLHYLDLWWAVTINAQEFLKSAKMSGLTRWSDEQRVKYDDQGVPVIFSNHYYTLKDPDEFASRLAADLEKVAPPWFVVVYGGSPHAFYEVAHRLPSERFKVVKLDEFFSAAGRSRDKMEGRVWRSGAGESKGGRP